MRARMTLGALAMIMGLALGLLGSEWICKSATAASPPIKMGVISAWDFLPGLGVKRGYEMAIEAINKQGGLLGREIVGVYVDNKGNPEEAKKGTARLLDLEKVDVMGGFWRSDLAIVCQDQIMQAKKILLLSGAGSPVLTFERVGKDYNKYKYTFSGIGEMYHLAPVYTTQIQIAMKKIWLKKNCLYRRESQLV